jgi:hypothetical protein
MGVMSKDDRFDEVVNEMASDYNAPPPVPRDLMWERIQAARKVTPLQERRVVPAWAAWGLGLAAMLAIGIGIGRMTRVDSAGKGAVATTTTPTTKSPAPSQTSAPAVASTASADSAAPTPGPEKRLAPRKDEDDVRTPAPTRMNRLASGAGVKPSPDEVNVSAPRTGWRGDRPANSDAAALPYRLAAVQHLTGAEALLTSYEAEARAGRQDDQMQAWSRDLLSTTRLLMDSPAGRDPKLRPLLEDLELVLAQIQQATSGRTSDRDMVVEGIQKRGVLPRIRSAIPAGPTAGI